MSLTALAQQQTARLAAAGECNRRDFTAGAELKAMFPDGRITFAQAGGKTIGETCGARCTREGFLQVPAALILRAADLSQAMRGKGRI